jgi:hypothetical protein
MQAERHYGCQIVVLTETLITKYSSYLLLCKRLPSDINLFHENEKKILSSKNNRQANPNKKRSTLFAREIVITLLRANHLVQKNSKVAPPWLRLNLRDFLNVNKHTKYTHGSGCAFQTTKAMNTWTVD